MGPGTRKLRPFLLLALAYAIAWALIYLLIPLRSADDWYRTCLWMTPTKALAFGGLLYLDRRAGMATACGLFRTHGPRPLPHGLLLTALWGLLWSLSSGLRWTWTQTLAGAAASLAIGFFEEYAYRGVVMDELQRRWGALPAVLGSSVLFTLSHLRPQAIPSWPHIFLTGAVFANLRLRGMGLGQLALIHAALDTLFFFVGKDMVHELGGARDPRAAGNGDIARL